MVAFTAATAGVDARLVPRGGLRLALHPWSKCAPSYIVERVGAIVVHHPVFPFVQQRLAEIASSRLETSPVKEIAWAKPPP